MSAAANAAGYLYAHGMLPTAKAKTEPVVPVAQPVNHEPVKPARTPKIEYRKRRVYAVPAMA